MLKFALLGRKGSGRAYFQKLLEKEGLKVAKSYTTREQRDENDNTHYFIKNVNDYDDRLLETTHDGFVYFYTRSELENAEIIPIDPQNLKALCEMFPDTAFRFIEIMASNENRLIHAVTNADDKLTAEADFIAACEEENEAFETFNNAAVNRELNIANISYGSAVLNDFTDQSDMHEWVNRIKTQFLQFQRILKICRELSEAGVIDTDESKSNYIVGVDNKEEPCIMSPDLLADDILFNKDSMYLTISLWLKLDENSFKD